MPLKTPYSQGSSEISEEVTDIAPFSFPDSPRVGEELRSRPPLGACCPDDGSGCFQTTQENCENDDVGGVYQGDYEPCDPDPCGVECPPDSAPSQMTIHAEFTTLEDYVLDCNGTSVIVSASGDIDFSGGINDLTWGTNLDGDCLACLSPETFGGLELDFTCPDTDCGGGQNADLFLDANACIRWDGSTWWLDAFAPVNTPEDFGVCGWDDENGANLKFDPISIDLGAGSPVASHTVSFSDIGRTCELTIVIS